METVVAFLKEEFKSSRFKAMLITLGITTVFAVFCALSFGVLSGFKILGFTVFDLFDYVSSNICLATCALLVSLFAGWKIKKEDFYDEITSSGRYKIPKWLLGSLRVFVRYIAPLIVAIIIINSLIGL